MVVEQRGSTADPTTWQTWIFSSGGRFLGSGVLLGGKYVLTCAHVVCEDGEPVAGLSVEFPANHRQVAAAPVEHAWLPPSTDDPSDVALLELSKPLPAENSATLALLSDWHQNPPEVRALGPASGHSNNQLARLNPIGKGGPQSQWVELDVLAGSAVEVGFSGGGAICTETGLILGIVVQLAEASPRAWMIPVESIREYLPQVAEWVVEHPRLRLQRLRKQVAELLSRLDGTWHWVTSGGRYSRRYQQHLVGEQLLATGLRLWEATASARDVVAIAELERIVAGARVLYGVGGEVQTGGGPAPQPAAGRIRDCPFRDCRGRIEETGYCDTCHRHPDAGQRSRGTVQVGEGSWLCAGLVRLPSLEFHNPTGQFDRAPRMSDGDRWCKDCEGQLARAVAGQQRCTTGFCPRCRKRFSFAPQLQPRAVVGDKYSVLGYLGRGGFGSIYLAKEKEFPDGEPVVIKALINQPEDESMILAERHHLTMLKHEKLVRALDFFRHPDESGKQHGYIVMEYVKGVTLEEMGKLAEPLPTKPGGSAPPRIVEIMAYGCEILEVFEYLHGRGLLYTDMSPSNVMRGETGIHIIDLGSVREQDDHRPSTVVNQEFCVPADEVNSGLSVGSDLYAVARTLQKLQEEIPTRTEDGRYRFSIESFGFVLERALREGEEKVLRFDSAAEMAGQLAGVLREILSLHDFESRNRPSVYFASATELQDNGLGAAPPLATWTEGSDGLADFGRPLPSQFVKNMPPPIIDRSDAHAAELAMFSGSDPGELQKYRSVESRLMQCRKLLEKSDATGAQQCVEEAETIGGLTAKWRIDWHAGLVALFEAKFGAAREKFEAVRRMLPAEAAPKIAIGYCLENVDGGSEEAETYYETVWRRDNGPASAVFGLARLHLAAGRRGAAVRVLGEVQKKSKHYSRAQVAAVRASLIELDSGAPPTAQDFADALKHLENLHKDDSHRLSDDDYHRLVAWLRQVAFDWLGVPGNSRLPSGDVLGRAPSRETLLPLLERSFSALAGQASSRREHDVLLDLKNRHRPLTRW
ncbi:trypsin-like peptidase domain-containing protein [Saccharopolyspora sp. K220]|uniref:tetratricopeptide repeat protein n=1 Tax=Saccharopolyspora soli TaxID=2926618 RepID=UPI001F56BBA1|nr:tetratricopeptide repeat protein [Saccharopolyspora soli]MCI2423689.1 trypsin-like peptidase domain-containing protein [Saccharopolyspora soli]